MDYCQSCKTDQIGLKCTVFRLPFLNHYKMSVRCANVKRSAQMEQLNHITSFEEETPDTSNWSAVYITYPSPPDLSLIHKQHDN